MKALPGSGLIYCLCLTEHVPATSASSLHNNVTKIRKLEQKHLPGCGLLQLQLKVMTWHVGGQGTIQPKSSQKVMSTRDTAIVHAIVRMTMQLRPSYRQLPTLIRTQPDEGSWGQGIQLWNPCWRKYCDVWLSVEHGWLNVSYYTIHICLQART
jgi:hypothetical protein